MSSPEPWEVMQRKPSPRHGERADEALLAQRLAELGIRSAPGVVTHANRQVLVSVDRAGRLRVHRGYAYASDHVLEAIVRFVSPVSSAGARRRAERIIRDFPVARYVPLRRRNAGGRYPRLTARLHRMHRTLNRHHFSGMLPPIRIRVSDRMHARLGEITVNRSKNRAEEIAISLTHLRCDGWVEAEKTLLHEMVHQWQVVSGLPADHGSQFRARAAAVGINPQAARDVRPAQPDLFGVQGRRRDGVQGG